MKTFNSDILGQSSYVLSLFLIPSWVLTVMADESLVRGASSQMLSLSDKEP